MIHFSLLLAACVRVSPPEPASLPAEVYMALVRPEVDRPSWLDGIEYVPSGSKTPVRMDLRPYRSFQERVPGRMQDPSTATVMSISGGGLRSANFAMGVMLALDAMPMGTGSAGHDPGLLAEVDGFSTVSGGGLATGLYLSLLEHEIERRGNLDRFSLAGALSAGPRAELGRDFIHDVFRRWPLQAASHADRGDALELAFDDVLLGARVHRRSLVLGDVFRPAGDEQPPHLPAWVANATVYRTDRIFPLVPHVLLAAHVWSYTHRMVRHYLNLALHPEGGTRTCSMLRKVRPPSPAKMRANSLRVRQFAWEFPLAVGMSASSTTPVLLAATTLGTADEYGRGLFLHLYDGAFSENLGVKTALDMLDTEPAPVRRKVLLVVDGFTNADSYWSSGFEKGPRINRTGPWTLFQRPGSTRGPLLDYLFGPAIAEDDFDRHRHLSGRVVGGVETVYLGLSVLAHPGLRQELPPRCVNALRQLRNHAYGISTRLQLHAPHGRYAPPFVPGDRDPEALQSLLFDAGRAVVWLQQDRLRAALGRPDPSGSLSLRPPFGFRTSCPSRPASPPPVPTEKRSPVTPPS